MPEVNLPFKATLPGDADGLKALECRECSQRLAPVTFVLDRLPPFLLVSYGLEQVSTQAHNREVIRQGFLCTPYQVKDLIYMIWEELRDRDIQAAVANKPGRHRG